MTASQIRNMLTKAWTAYREHEKNGDDMAAAGEELARVVGRIVRPVPCAAPRNEVLERKQEEARRKELEELFPGMKFTGGEAVPLDDLDGGPPHEYRP